MSIDKLLEKEPSLEFVIPVLKWLKNPESVSQDELTENKAASAAYAAACAAANTDAYTAAYAAAYAAYAAVNTAAEKWINKYFTRILLTRKEVKAELFKEEAIQTNDVVQNPKHYELFEDTQVIEIIASSMSTEAFHGYCLGNILKYRLRAGNKDNAIQELAKADKYKELYEDFKHLCK